MLFYDGSRTEQFYGLSNNQGVSKIRSDIFCCCYEHYEKVDKSKYKRYNRHKLGASEMTHQPVKIDKRCISLTYLRR